MIVEGATLSLSVSVIAAVAFPITLILIILICTQCFGRKPSGAFSVSIIILYFTFFLSFIQGFNNGVLYILFTIHIGGRDCKILDTARYY